MNCFELLFLNIAPAFENIVKPLYLPAKFVNLSKFLENVRI